MRFSPAFISRCACASLLALALGGCVTNPITRERDVVFLSTEDEVRAGEEGAEQVAAAMGIVAAPALTEFVTEVGRRVAANVPPQGYEYRFEIVDLPEPNAFALPGGHVYVSRGLLALTNDEDQLANVLAHEIVHVAARHHAQRQARAAGVGLLALPGLLVGGLVGGPVGNIVSAPFAIAGVGAIASYSRGQETEADEYGQSLAAEAGYAPGALSVFLASLERDEQLRTESPEAPSWFDSHPATPQRVEKTAKRALAGGAPPAGSRTGYLEHLDGLLVGENPAEGVFAGQRFLHADLDFTLEFPEGWKTVNTRRAVGAYLEDGRAQIILEQQAGSDDPREAANAFLADLSERARVSVAGIGPVEVAGRDAVRGQVLVATRNGQVAVDATWISHGGAMYRLAGIVPKGYGAEDRRVFGAVGQSFAPLQPLQREAIRETRLRLREARAGESLTQFSLRTGNRWGLEETAVVNGLPADASLAAGQRLKVAIQQPYAPAAPLH